MKDYIVLRGAIWTEFDELRGANPIASTPANLSEEIKFTISLRGMSVFSSRPTNISYSKMIATIPFPEYEFFTVSTVLYEYSENSRGGYKINLISMLIPALFMQNSWVDLRQIQAVFQQYFATYEGAPVSDKLTVISAVATAVDMILQRKLEIINQGEIIRSNLNKYLESYHVLSLKEEERSLIKTRVRTLIQLLDRVLEAGNNERIQRALLKMNFVLEQELSEELVMLYQKSLTSLITPEA
ncbi:MAG: hypothetical protein ACXACP_09195 [Candidatus Hodarchaeales archaeon]|jgi:hypothetical protein